MANSQSDQEKEEAAKALARTVLTSLPDEHIEWGEGPHGPYLFRKDNVVCGPAELAVLGDRIHAVANPVDPGRRIAAPINRGRQDRRQDSYLQPDGYACLKLRADLNAQDVVRDLRNLITDEDLGELHRDRRQLAINVNHVFTAGGIFKFGPESAPRRTGTQAAIVPFAAPANVLPEDMPVVAVLDTGVVGGGDLPPGQAGVSFNSHMTDAGDPNDSDPLAVNGDRPIAGHGTFVAGILCREAGLLFDPEATLSGSGITDEEELLADINDVAGRQPDVACLSLYGYPVEDNIASSFRPRFAAAIAQSPDTVWVAAAGNDGLNRAPWPAGLDDVVAVASVNAAGDGSSFSNFGGWVDVCALGEDVVSTYLNRTVRIGQEDVQFDGRAQWSGTSFAVPVVCAAIVRKMRQGAGMTAKAALQELLKGQKVKDFGVLVR